MEQYTAVLKNEFEAAEGSFLIRIRPGLDWDKDSFTRLVMAMRLCCEQSAQSNTMDRWAAQGFWFIPAFVRDWTTHPNFPRIYAPEYYERAYQRLDDLAYWFFFGESPYTGNAGFDPM